MPLRRIKIRAGALLAGGKAKTPEEALRLAGYEPWIPRYVPWGLFGVAVILGAMHVASGAAFSVTQLIPGTHADFAESNEHAKIVAELKAAYDKVDNG